MFDPPEERAVGQPAGRLASVLLAVLSTATACAGSPPEQMLVGELLPLLRTVVPQPDVFSATGDAALLGTGTQVRESPGLGKLLVVRGHRTEVGFQATGGTGLSIDVQMRRAPGDDAAQRTFRMLLNGVEILDGDVPTQWQRFVADVGAAQVQPATNRLEVVFSAAPGDPDDEPVVPARIRWVHVKPVDLPLAWPERPTVVETDARGDLVMPVDSLAELAVHLPGKARLRGSLVGTAAAGQRARSMRASVRLLAGPALDADGRLDPAAGATATPAGAAGGDSPSSAETSLEIGILPGGESRELDLDLSPWAGRLVALRLRVAGPGNGTVTWAGLRLEHAPGERPEPLPRTPVAPGSVPASATFAGRDVIVILLDAARADAFSAYGASRPTPAVDALAADGVLFERAVSAAPWTAPSVSTLLTGLLPDAHGVEAWDRGLPKPVSTLGEYFQAAGYRTVIWSQHLLYRTNPTLRRGFDEILEVDPEERDLLPELSDLLADDGPSFVLVHLLVPHAPYTPPAPWADRYAAATGGASIEPGDPSFARPFQRNWDPLEPDPADVALLRDRYDEMVAWADALVGRLLAGLRTSGRYDDALLILTSDHGEAFWEHGSFLHTRLLHDEVLRVPLIVKLPGGARGGARWQSTVSLLDLPATLVDAAGLQLPPRLSEAAAAVGMQGRSLLPVLTGTAAATDPQARPSAPYATTRAALFRRQPERRRLSIESHGHKLLLDTVWGDTELYAVGSSSAAAGGAETTDLATLRPILTLWLRQAATAQHLLDRALLDAYMGSDPSGTDLDLSNLEALESLGYLR